MRIVSVYILVDAQRREIKTKIEPTAFPACHRDEKISKEEEKENGGKFEIKKSFTAQNTHQMRDVFSSETNEYYRKLVFISK
jgi:hypothetical protein